MESKEFGNGIDMDRYPSVVLISALDTPSNAFETEVFLQVRPYFEGLFFCGICTGALRRVGVLSPTRDH